MTTRSMPSEEYKKRIKDRHILEGFSLIAAVAMLVLAAVYLLEIDRSLWVLETIAVLGGIMNYTLAVRAILVRSWIQTITFFLAGCACFGLLAWLNWT